MPNSLLNIEMITSEALQVLANNLRFGGFSVLNLRVWDGDSYYGCARLVDEDGPHVGRVRFTCGKCRDGILAAPGDVCEFCWCVACEVEKIGETVNVKRPMRFESTGRAGGKTAAAAAFSGVKF